MRPLDRPVRVVLANDVELIVAGLEALLAPHADRVTVVGKVTGDPTILPAAVSESGADVLLIDAFSRSGAGLDAALAGVQAVIDVLNTPQLDPAMIIKRKRAEKY